VIIEIVGVRTEVQAITPLDYWRSHQHTLPMQRHSPRASRAILLVSATMLATASSSVSMAQNFSAPLPPAASSDTTTAHHALRKSIEGFQDTWRKAWQKVEIKRHKFIDLNRIRGWLVQSNGVIDVPTWDGDRMADNRTPELRRYLAILCYVNTPTDEEIEQVKARARENIGTAVRNGAMAASVAEDAALRGMRSTTPRGAAGIGGVSFVTPRAIQPSPNSGAVCPSWTPDEETISLDEGEAIDLAIPPDEREPLRKQRDALIRKLEAEHARFPMNDWIAGQRLRFVFDQRSPERSMSAARACRGTAAWCAALVGIALEQAGRIPEAEAAFRAVDSLARAQGERDVAACIDPETLLLFRQGDRDDITRGSCAAQRERVEHMWWLADPLWSVPGNERFVAHGSRRTHATLRAALHRDERYVWDKRGGGAAMRELVVRYGWPSYTYWPGGQLEEEMNKLREGGSGRAAGFPFPPYTAKEYSPDRTATIPSVGAITDPFSAKASDWSLRIPEGTVSDSWWPQEHMMLHTRLEPLGAGQHAQWRRDSSLVYAMAVDNALRGLDTAVTGPSNALLMVGARPGDIRTLATTQVIEGHTLRLRGEIAPAPLVMSAEVQPRSLREPARRHRFGLRPLPSLREMGSNDVAVSEPVFLRLPNRNSPAPTDIAGVSMLMAGDLTFARTEPLALYWESYGFPLRDSLQFQMRVVRNDDVGVVRRIGAALGVASDMRDSIVITWTEPDSRQGTALSTTSKTAVARTIALDIRALPPGSYIVSIDVRRGANMFARAERRFVLRDP
jgi:hypothetical protein